MKKTMKILSNVFGGFFLLCALIMLFENNINGYASCIILLALSFMMFPTFELFCKLINKQFSLGRKIALGIGTFFFPMIGISSVETPAIDDLYGVVGVIIIYWIIMIVTNKKVYVDKNAKCILKESDKQDIFHKFYNRRIEKHNAKVKALIECEQKIRNNFINLDIITMHAIANMVSETKEKHKTIFNEDMPEINMRVI